ncbi:MAG: DNA repair protein RadA [Deltaproteobacteria bacterium]|nr:DNA repair protein RadA [Deltaproteobacteria bacterium]
MKEKKTKSFYRCLECGYESVKWLGKCPSCGSWNSFEETVPVAIRHSPMLIPGKNATPPEAQPLNAISMESERRICTPMLEWDRVLGGGLVPGSLVLLAGDPGMGKSTLLLQVLASLSTRQKVLYVSGEESRRQIKLRANRLGVGDAEVLVASETTLEAILELISAHEIEVVAIDSIQTIASSLLDATTGTITQIRHCTDRLLQMAKTQGVTVIIVGHVTKEGIVAGPKALEHLVDVVLYLEGDRTHTFRLLRSVKNRYGSTNEIGVFEMKDRGLEEVRNPSQMFLAERPIDAPGSVVMATIEGTRPLLVEIQALVSYSALAVPRRTATGFDANRASLLMAVLEKRLGISFAQEDVFINVAGGIKLREPAADMAVCLALMSSYFDRPLPHQLVTWGEVGLTGEVRAVGYSDVRYQEAIRLGFNKVMVPATTAEQLKKEVKPRSAVEIVTVKSLKDVLNNLFK